MPVFLRDQPALRDAKSSDGQRRGHWKPNEMDPEWRFGRRVEEQRGDDDQGADDENEERRGAIPNVERTIVQAARPA